MLIVEAVLYSLRNSPVVGTLVAQHSSWWLC